MQLYFLSKSFSRKAVTPAQLPRCRDSKSTRPSEDVGDANASLPTLQKNCSTDLSRSGILKQIPM